MSANAGISFGGALRWYDGDRFAKEMGLTRRAFRALCKALTVPMIEIGEQRLVCLPMFKVAMWAVSRIGEPDFLVPGCETLRRSRAERRRCATALDVDHLRSCWETVVDEMMAARKLEGMKEDKETRSLAKMAAEQLLLVTAQLHPHLHEEVANGQTIT